MKQLPLLLLLLLTSYFHFGGTNQGQPPYLDLYNRAERLYNTDDPTTQTDSLAFHFFSQAIHLLEKERTNDSLLIDSYTKAAILKQMKGQDSIAIYLFNRALRVADSNPAISDSARFFPLLYCGSSYYTLYQFDSAQHYYQQAETLVDKYPRLPEKERLYNKVGTLYYEEGNFHQSLNYFSRALSLLDTTNASNNFLMVNYYNNIAVTYKKLGRYNDALNTYQLLLPYRINQDGLMQNIATVYLDLNQPDKALQYLHAVKQPSQQQYNNLALAHLNRGMHDSAAFYIQKAFENRTHSFKSTVNGLSWHYLGRLQEAQQQYEQALNTYHRAVIELDPDFSDTVISSNPTQFNGLHSFSDLFNAITAKARVQRSLYTKTKQAGFLEQSLQSWETALLLARTVQQGYDADESRLFLNQNLQPASEEAAFTALMLHQAKPSKKQLEKIFELSETSKAAVLQIRLRQSSLAALPGMPTELLSRQKTQQILLGRLQVQYERTTDTAILANLQRQILDQEIKLSEINRQLNDHPQYAAARTADADLDIAKLQEALPADMAMLSYYFIPDRWLAFALTRDSLFVEQLPANDNMKQLLETMRRQLSLTNLSSSQLSAPAAGLYQWLVQPLVPHLGNVRRLMIIPDHDIQYLPFEVLPAANGKRLQESFAISYNYSAVFYGRQHEAGNASAKQLGLAPFGGNRKVYQSGLLPLPASNEEITPIRGDKLVDSAATKDAFLKHASSYSSIHLATHAAANDVEPENSFIAFYPTGADTNYKLYQPEIYNLDLHRTQLVILSACETGRGQFVHGEGMMSLARAFSYAGCKSVITSLWKADDASTAYIARRLHHHLQAGKPKDVALQQAKLDYLEDASIPERLKTPAYWSHLVLIGDTGPLYSSSFSAWWIVAVLACVAAIIAFIRLRRRRN